MCVEAGLYTGFPKLQEYHLLTISFLRGLCSTLGKSGNWLKSLGNVILENSIL